MRMAVDNIISNIGNLKSEERKDLISKFVTNFEEVKTPEIAESLLSGMSSEDQVETIANTYTRFSDKEKKETKARVASIDGPSEDVRDLLWTIVVLGFAIVMVGAFLSIAWGAFHTKPDNPVVSGDILLSVFTAAVGFFGGLFASTKKG